jgi:fatty acid desaturase
VSKVRKQKKTEERVAEKRNRGDGREGRRTVAAYTTTPVASAAASVATAPGNFLPSPIVLCFSFILQNVYVLQQNED